MHCLQHMCRIRTCVACWDVVGSWHLSVPDLPTALPHTQDTPVQSVTHTWQMITGMHNQSRTPNRWLQDAHLIDDYRYAQSVTHTWQITTGMHNQSRTPDRSLQYAHLTDHYRYAHQSRTPDRWLQETTCLHPVLSYCRLHLLPALSAAHHLHFTLQISCPSIPWSLSSCVVLQWPLTTVMLAWWFSHTSSQCVMSDPFSSSYLPDHHHHHHHRSMGEWVNPSICSSPVFYHSSLFTVLK